LSGGGSFNVGVATWGDASADCGQRVTGGRLVPAPL